MLRHVYIQNFVLMDALELSFEDGFSAFTGETGAGKSILIDAISLLCGGRASADYIRHGKDKAVIEAVFEVEETHPVQALLSEYGLELEEGNLVVTRELMADGKSTARLQRRQCSATMLKEIVGSLVDIHSQHDNHYLLNPKHYLPLLDQFDGSNQRLLVQYQQAYGEYAKVKKEYEIFLSEQLNEADLDILVHQREEILSLDLRPGEVEELEERALLLGNMEKILLKANMSLGLLQGEVAVVDHLYEAKQSLLAIHETNLFEQLAQQLDSLYYQVADVAETLADLMQSIQGDEAQLNLVQERLYTIHRIQRKYGGSEASMKQRLMDMEQQINQIEHRQEYIDEMEKTIRCLEDKAMKLAEALSQDRQKKANRLEKAIEQELQDLHLPNARFAISFKPTTLTRQGIDQVSFLVAMNKGESLKPLDKTASGGEISRFMLGLKVIFTKLENISTVIFDEIDTGISGPTAFAIGRKMRQLSMDAQVFGVTHLAPVAASAKTQYLIAKSEKEDVTVSSIQRLDGETRIAQLALLSSGNQSPASFLAAQELLAMASKE